MPSRVMRYTQRIRKNRKGWTIIELVDTTTERVVSVRVVS